MRYAQISKDGSTVVNIIAADDDLKEWAGLLLEPLDDTTEVGPGWARTGAGVYTASVEAPEPLKMGDFFVVPSKSDPTEFVLVKA